MELEIELLTEAGMKIKANIEMGNRITEGIEDKTWDEKEIGTAQPSDQRW